MKLEQAGAAVVLAGLALLIVMGSDAGLITWREALYPICVMLFGYAVIGYSAFERSKKLRQLRTVRAALPVGTTVMVINPIASKETYHTGDIAVIREHSWTSNRATMFYRVEWISPPPPGIDPAKRVLFLHDSEVTPHPCDPLFGTTSSTGEHRPFSRISKPL